MDADDSARQLATYLNTRFIKYDFYKTFSKKKINVRVYVFLNVSISVFVH